MDDYDSFSGTTVIFSAGTAAGETTDITVNVHDDNTFEPTEFFMLLINPNPAERLSTREDGSTAVAYIIDNDGELVIIIKLHIYLQLW